MAPTGTTPALPHNTFLPVLASTTTALNILSKRDALTCGIPPECAFTSLSQVFEIVTAQNTTIWDIVHRCENVCSLAWGSGNPDLSGVGANTAYIIQVVLLFLVGLVMCSVWKFGRLGYYTISPEMETIFDDIRNSFVDINSQFSISVALAAVIRTGDRDLPFFEVAFLSSLLDMQFYAMSTVAVSFEFVRPTSMSLQRTAVVYIYLLMELLLCLEFKSRLGRPKQSYEVSQQLFCSCRAYKPLQPRFFDQDERYEEWREDGGHMIFWQILGHSVLLTILEMLPYIQRIIMRSIQSSSAVCPSSNVRPRFSKGLIYSPHELLLYLNNFFTWSFRNLRSVIFESILFKVTTSLLVSLETERNTMKHVTGRQFKDDEWGFGQILAVLIWMPFIFQSISSASRYTHFTFKYRADFWLEMLAPALVIAILLQWDDGENSVSDPMPLVYSIVGAFVVNSMRGLLFYGTNHKSETKYPPSDPPALSVLANPEVVQEIAIPLKTYLPHTAVATLRCQPPTALEDIEPLENHLNDRGLYDDFPEGKQQLLFPAARRGLHKRSLSDSEVVVRNGTLS